MRNQGRALGGAEGPLAPLALRPVGKFSAKEVIFSVYSGICRPILPFGDTFPLFVGIFPFLVGKSRMLLPPPYIMGYARPCEENWNSPSVQDWVSSTIGATCERLAYADVADLMGGKYSDLNRKLGNFNTTRSSDGLVTESETKVMKTDRDGRTEDDKELGGVLLGELPRLYHQYRQHIRR